MTDLGAETLATLKPPPAFELPLGKVGAVVVGNALEFYDFLTYAYFAVYIGHTFFPGHDPTVSLLLSLGAFGVGFITRPIGAVVIGALGDRVGRKPAMMLSFSLMGLGIVGLALTPSYARIGLAAPILVLVFRLLQGFALGGEVGPSTAYLVETAPVARRGLYGSMQYASQNVAILFAGLVGTLLASTLSPQQVQDWGWRLAMLIGVGIVPFGLWIRRDLPESLHAAPAADAAPIPRSPGDLRRLAPLIACGLFMLIGGTIGTYVGIYMTTYAMTTLRLGATAAYGVAIVKGLVAMLMLPLGGWLSDRFGRKPVLVIPGVLLLFSILPAFWLMVRVPTPLVVDATVAGLTVLSSVGAAPVIVVLTEALPRKIRSSVVATIYALAISIFGGSTQFCVAWLQRATGDPLAPGLIWTVAALVGLIAAALVRETAPAKLTKLRPR